ncbi:MAG: glycosidase [Desulfomonile sp.]|nr:glycosidase [Desulfomonile sp.]
MKGSPNPALFQRHPNNPILCAKDWPYPVNSVFNAGATLVGEEYVLVARVEDRTGMSHLCVARSNDGVDGWIINRKPSLLPSPETHPEEMWGIEDPRITWLEDLGAWAITYTAYSEAGPLVSLAITEDFVDFRRLGPVMPPEDKDAALFPAKFSGRYAMLHRPVSAFAGVGKHIWISFSPDLKHWGDHRVLIRARRGAWWDANKIGVSPPPLETPHGWLILYHGVRETPGGCIYRLGLALLDREDPTKVIKRSDQWVFGPQEPYETNGDVGNVVFPCGWILNGNELLMYYGAADTCIALASAQLTDLLDFLEPARTG